MLTIHCFFCGQDECLSGVPGTPSTPLPAYRSKHYHNLPGKQHCRLLCPCGASFLIDTRQMNHTQIEDHIEQCFQWSLKHVKHMRDSEKVVN